ncbi:MAG: mannonate dehydratase [Halobacteriales archaeon]
MRVGVRTRTLGSDRLAFCKQIGVDDVFLDHRSPRGDVFTDEGDDFDATATVTIDESVVPSVDTLLQAKERAAEAGIRLLGVQSLSYNVYGKIMLGQEGRAQQLETIKQLLRNLGEAEIPILGYQWNPRGVVPMRTGYTRLRGGAEGRAFDIDVIDDPYNPVEDLDREYAEAELWEHYETFLEEVLPVAETAGVTMALHPADPPTVEQLGGIPRLFRSFEAFKRAMGAVPSDSHGLKLCLGCFAEMPETDIREVVRYFGQRNEIVFVHFRDVVGTWPTFHETFIDDTASNFDPLSVMETLQETDFDGVIVPDHVPDVINDTDWGHRGRAHAVGYLNGLVQCIRKS